MAKAGKTITIYGIKNCDTMKKARAWLDKHGVAYAFHDYKSAGIDRGRLEASPILFEFLEIMRAAPIAPWPLRPVQWLLIRAAVDLTPGWVRERLGLGEHFGLRRWQWPLVRLLGALADRVVLRFSPAVQSCRRLGLPADYLHRRRGTG